MPQTVKALVKAGAGPGAVVRAVELRDPGPDEVLVRPIAVGLCGADVKTYRWHPDRRPFLNESMPVILGHEVAGVVERLGTAVTGLAVGDRVLTDPLVSCGRCRLCTSGRPNICEHRRQLGYQVDGGAAEQAVLPARTLVPLPATVAWLEAPVLEVLAIAVHAIQRAGLVTGQPCAVVGPGPLGQMLVRALAAAGAGPILVVGTDSSAARVGLALAHGATDSVIGPVSGEHLNGYEVVFEVAGTAEALETAGRLVRRGGRILYASGSDIPTALRMNTDLKLREVDLLTSTGHPPTAWECAINLARQGQVSLGGVVDLVLPLESALDGLAAMSERRAVKSVVVCAEDTVREASSREAQV